MSDDLPEPAIPPCARCNKPTDKWEGTYTADQMREYAATRAAAAVAKQTETIRSLREALEKLACLGNGDRHGNSIGNDIARAALEKTK